MTTQDENTTDRVAELLHHSGPRPAPSMKGFEAARAEAHAAWQADLRLARKRQRVQMGIFALATAAVVVLAVRYYESPRVNVNDVFRTGADERTRLMLANGVELRLDVDTEIRFAGETTLALERGAVFVDTGSSHAAGPSVEIRTAAGVARDIGTKFEVRVLANTTRVRVREGIVHLTHGGSTHTARPGTELVAGVAGVTQHDVPIAGPDWNWVALAAAPFSVEGKTLAQFLEWAAREGGWEILFADDALRQSSSTIVLHGSIAGLTPGQALDTILPTCGLTHRIERNVVTVQAAARSGDRK
jgi:ferric-dicitrate binding protein FerR (iron transport regulator)